MTVVRLDDGGLWLHSPVEHSAQLQQAITSLGPISAIIAPNSYHYLQVDAWASANSSAAVFASADVAHKMEADAAVFGKSLRMNWSEDIKHLTVELGKFTETVFFHPASKSLIVTDLMQTFEAGRIRSLWPRLLLVIGGATGPNAKPSIEIRMAARKHRRELRAAVQEMVAWKPERIILSHGPCIETGPIQAIRDAFRWLGP
jgi:hypothetical protein